MSDYQAGCECKAEAFRAVARKDGEQRLLKVTGTCTCNEGGYSLVLMRDNEGIADDPTNMRLVLITQRAPFGPATITQTPVLDHAEFEVAAEVTKVSISITGHAERLIVPVTDS